MNVLVDSSIWSLALRRKPSKLSALERARVAQLSDLVRSHRARLIGPIRQELLTGIRHREQFQGLRETLRAYLDERLQEGDYEFAAEISNRCMAAGLTVGSVDALLGAVAIHRGWTLFTADADFDAIARYAPLRLHAELSM